MKYLNLSILFFILIGCNPNGENNSTETTVSLSDTVVIGNQTWTSVNWYSTTFSNGDTIPEAPSYKEWKAFVKLQQPCWMYYENPKNPKTPRSILYNWYAISDPRKLAPAGWKIPDQKDWNEMIDYLGGTEMAGPKLRHPEYWHECVSTNESGFNLLPSGLSIDGGFLVYENGVWLWSTSTKNEDHLFYVTGDNACGFSKGYYKMDTGAGVRLLRDK